MLDLPELYILRHGETDWNVEGRMQGRFDSDLTPLGQQQALAMGAQLRALLVGPLTHRWISSPQRRAIATARLALADDVPVHLDARLSEIGMGDWAGLTRTEINAGWPGPPDEDMIALYARIPNGESFADLESRCRDFLSDLTGPTVIVTHGMTSRFLRMVALGLTTRDLLGLPGGQGVVHHIRSGKALLVDCNGLHAAGSTGIPPL